MSPFPLVIFLTLAAGPDRSTPPGCRADYDSCHEDCTIEYGGSTTKYRQLTQCVDKCLSEQDDCTTRHYSLRDAQMDEPSGRSRARSSGSSGSSGGTDEFGDTRPAASPPGDGSRRGVYRASDEEAPARPEPAVSREPTRAPAPEPEPEPTPPPAARAPAAKASAPPREPPREPAAAPPPPVRTKSAPAASSSHDEDIPVFGADASKDEPEEAPAPKPKPAPAPSAPLHPTPPPEPKKKDISDWDPNAK